MTIAYFDCFSGAGGDMIVGALIDAGADVGALRQGLSSLGVDGYSLSIERIKKQGFAATRFDVRLDPSVKPAHRHFHHIRDILQRSTLNDRVRGQAIRVFERLAEAEAKVHGSTVEKVHFHEVGAIDAIVDVVGAMIALELLGVDRVECSPIPTGSGTVRCEHGVMPVPAPGTAELLKGVPIAACDEGGELTTPTAAAVLTTLCEKYGPMPAMTVRSIGYGAGSRDGKTRPNVLRVLIGDAAANVEADVVTMLETNIDDASPQVVAYCLEKVLAAGARDAFITPIVMKKGRCGVLLTVLCEPSMRSMMETIIFAETPTLGIRHRTMDRTVLGRREETVATEFGRVRMKIGALTGGLCKATPEYEDCKSIALAKGVSLQQVMAAAQRAWGKLDRSGS